MSDIFMTIGSIKIVPYPLAEPTKIGIDEKPVTVGLDTWKKYGK